MGHLDYLQHLSRESARFADVLRAAPPDARVPSCPDWAVDDLLWHLGEVQWFWGTIVRAGLTDTADVRTLEHPDRPGDHAGLTDFFADVSATLHRELSTHEPAAPAWTWAPDHTVGFIRRRQAHEALIHRVDAELATANRTPMDPALSADGVDEVLRVMYGGAPVGMSFRPQADPLRVRATDTGDTWLVTAGRLTGTDPEAGEEVDEPGIEVAPADPGGPAAAEVSGTAADLDCWLWRRSTPGPVRRSGEQDPLDRFEAVVSVGID